MPQSAQSLPHGQAAVTLPGPPSYWFILGLVSRSKMFGWCKRDSRRKRRRWLKNISRCIGSWRFELWLGQHPPAAAGRPPPPPASSARSFLLKCASSSKRFASSLPLSSPPPVRRSFIVCMVVFKYVKRRSIVFELNSRLRSK